MAMNTLRKALLGAVVPLARTATIARTHRSGSRHVTQHILRHNVRTMSQKPMFELPEENAGKTMTMKFVYALTVLLGVNALIGFSYLATTEVEPNMEVLSPRQRRSHAEVESMMAAEKERMMSSTNPTAPDAHVNIANDTVTATKST
eukprot:m.9329 g.9329  ORF g.9329 m.9329 type:complete len:147 (+) comp5441_c0_seq1:282-722(+)